MAKKKEKDFLLISIISFIVVALIALYLVLNKGHIGSIALVKIGDEAQGEKLTQTIEVSLDKEYISSKDKEETEIFVKVDGEAVTEGVEYASSDEDIVKIKDGKAVAVKNGRAIITAKKGDIADSAEIQVITPIKNMTLTAESKSIKVGNELQMELATTPSGASIETVSYKSSNEEVATVTVNGIVKGISKGKVKITVIDSYTGKEDSVNLTMK